MTETVLARLAKNENLSMAEMADVIDAVMQGRWSEEQIAGLLTGLRDKGETVEEIAGAAQAMRRNMQQVAASRETIVDTCGTGGDGSQTFNISTAAALVTAAAEVAVAKHGNRGVTSKSGSADVLAELGVNLAADLPTVERCLEELGVCFCFAQQFHPAMKHVAAVRKKLATPTIFNLLGPLCNPAGAPFQVIGVGKPRLRPLLADALALLKPQRALVLCGDDGLDEITLAGATSVTEVRPTGQSEHVWRPSDFGLTERADLTDLRVDAPAASAAMIRSVLQGKQGAPRDIVIINAAAAIWVAGDEAMTLAEAAKQAAEAIDSGAAEQLLSRLAEMSQS